MTFISRAHTHKVYNIDETGMIKQAQGTEVHLDDSHIRHLNDNKYMVTAVGKESGVWVRKIWRQRMKFKCTSLSDHVSSAIFFLFSS